MGVAALPDLDALEFEALKALFLSHHEQHLGAISAQGEEIDRLRPVVEKLQRMLFGVKSEKVSIQLEQLEFQLEELETAHGADEASVDPPSRETTPRTKPFRKPLPEHLPREVVTHLPEHDCCPGCGGALRRFGEDVAEQLERIPASFKPGPPRTGLRPWGGG